ncbi:AsmA family protein [Martelella radicis]|uniref:AsmA protein n=1 Tax=Martelella radicis TaxID=1397476 RepID=A0A7W6KLM5_9HYPH|nr:AsmA-like C-terminal region-containing protein [Martelella radicis]MBB4122389.1 AsmA protein [Martelella radicis]
MGRPLRISLAIVLLAGVMVYYLVPFVITPQSLADDLEADLSSWLGAPASISGDVDISYWPRPRVSATAVSVARPDGAGPLIYGNSSRLVANFGFLGALAGNPSFADIKLDGAVIIFEQPDAPKGPPANALAREIAAIDGEERTPGRTEGPGTLSVTNSTLGFASDGETRIVKGVNAELDWPTLSGKVRLSGSAILAERATQFSLEAGEAAAMIAGGPSPINLNLSSETANIRFDGTASRSRPYLLDGTFSLSTGALQELMAKMGVESSLLRDVDSASLNGKVSRSGGSLRFSPVELTIGAAKGNGVLDIVPSSPDGPVEISATMALQEVSLLDAQSSLPAWIDAVAPVPEGGATDALPLPDLDLRVSAGTVKLSDLTLRDVAASIIRTGAQTSFDIADSRLDDGSLFAHLAVRNDGTANVRMNVENVRSGPLFKQLGFSVPIQSDQFSLEMSYEARLPLSEDGRDGLNGRFRFSGRVGNLTWLDLGDILQSAAASENFAFSPLKREPFSFASISGEGSLAGTTIRLDSLVMETAGGRVRLSGDIDLGNGQIEALLTSWSRGEGTEPVSVRISGNALAALARRVDTPSELLE